MATNKQPKQEAASNEKNIYIPSFIAAKPFYVGDSESDYLEHQRLKAESKDTLDKAKWYDRGRKLGPAATKYRKGACENCGAMTHKTKDCLSRPRKHGAKWTGRDIQADERVEDVKLGWDAKRDRWNGYDAREYDAVVQEYEDMDTLRQSAAKSKTPGEASSDPTQNQEEQENGNDDTAKYAEETDMGRSQPTSTRQLRLREDTAKYLLDLDLDSARYDPKTRSMDVDSSSLKPDQTGEFDGFVRKADASDDAAAFERAQRYAWETQERNNGNAENIPSTSSSVPNMKQLHLQANPTEGEFLLKKKTIEDAERKAQRQKALLDKYGPSSTSTSTSTSTINPTNPSSKSLQASTSQPAKPLTIPSSSSTYLEYDKYGNPKPSSNALALPGTKPRSKYAEDILTNNHTSIWGSYWHNFTWGYACCHSFVKNSYCTGDAGRVAFEEAEGLRAGEGLVAAEVATEDNEQVDDEKTDARNPKHKRGKRPFEDMHGGLTEAEMEDYKRSKMAADDPMNRFHSLTDAV